MARIPLFGLGIQSRSRAVTDSLFQNFYIERRPQGEKSELVAYGTPGLDLFKSFGDTPNRGALSFEPESLFYVVHRGTLYEVNNAAVATAVGTLNTTEGRVSMDHDGTTIVIVDGTDGYTYNTSTNTFAEITDVDFIDNPSTVTWMDQYFIVENGLVFQISASPTSWAATDIGVPETNPDSIVRVFADHGELLVFNQITIEPWSNTGATDFPFAPIKSSVAEWGCAAKWSVCKFNDSVAFLAQNKLGQVSICLLKGYVPQVISTPDIDHIINGYMSVSDASAFSYMLGGHPMYQINFPSAGYSWLYDGRENFWSAVKSQDVNRQRCEFSIQFVSRTLVFDYSDGSIYSLNPNTYTENGEMIEGEIVSNNVSSPDGERFSIDRLRVDMETGVGLVTGQGSDPQIMLQMSRDRGHSYGSELWQSMGKLGEYGKRVEWRRLGTVSTDMNFKLRITDPVKRVLISACINPSD